MRSSSFGPRPVSQSVLTDSVAPEHQGDPAKPRQEVAARQSLENAYDVGGDSWCSGAQKHLADPEKEALSRSLFSLTPRHGVIRGICCPEFGSRFAAGREGVKRREAAGGQQLRIDHADIVDHAGSGDLRLV